MSEFNKVMAEIMGTAFWAVAKNLGFLILFVFIVYWLFFRGRR